LGFSDHVLGEEEIDHEIDKLNQNLNWIEEKIADKYVRKNKKFKINCFKESN